jgi:predicted amidohydrolase YtcJ
VQIEETHMAIPAATADSAPASSAPRLADWVVRAGSIYAMTPDRAVHRAIALRDGWIVAAAADPHGLDGLIAPGTRVLHDPALTSLPALDDNHNHFILAADNLSLVPADQAHSIADLVDLLRQRAAQTPAGQWIRTSTQWNEADLAEGRLPTARELDEATTAHPIWVKRGGHVAAANSLALQLAGITSETQAPPGVILENPAMSLVERVIPPTPFADQVAQLRHACRVYNAAGIGTVRDPVVSPDQLLVYQALRDRGELSVRTRPMFLIPQGTVADQIAVIAGLGVRSGFGDDVLKIWGLKAFMDGGVDAAALDAPYADDPNFAGRVFWKTDDLVQVAAYAVERGWRIGIHAIGDRAVRTALDAFERVMAAHPDLKPGTLAIEHALLADESQRGRAIRAGVAITVQQPLLYSLAANFRQRWGVERTERINPTKAWLTEGALLSAGTDSPPTPYEPLLAIWSMVTRGTKQAGIVGPDLAIDRFAAFRLYTAGSAELNWEGERRGTIQPGRLADLVAYEIDPLTCPIDTLPTLRPALTLVGGRAVHDTAGRFA